LRGFANSLEHFTNSLKTNLTTIIHDDYADFVSISRQLVQLGEHMSTLTQALQHSGKAVAKASTDLEASMQPLQVHSEKLHSVRYEHAICSVALDAIEHLQRIEGALTENCDIFAFLDVAVGLSVSRAKVSILERPSERRPLEQEIDGLHQRFCEVICERFMAVVNQRNEEHLSIVLNSVILCQLESEIYDTFSRVFLGPFLRSLDSRVNCDVFSEASRFITSHDSDFSFVYHRSPLTFDFMIRSFWPIVSAFMSEKLGFPMGDRVEQHKNYQQWINFLDVCESHCRSKAAVKRLRQSREYHLIRDKLGLNVYAQLVSKRIFDDLDRFFSDEPAKNPPFRLRVSGEVQSRYECMFRPDTFVPEQAKDFAIIGMKLIHSLNRFALSAEQRTLPLFVSDLRQLTAVLADLTPVFLRPAMNCAVHSLDDTARNLVNTVLRNVVREFTDALEYIDGAFAATRSGVASARLISAVKTFREWAAKDGALINDDDFFARFLAPILAEFLRRANDTLTNVRRTAEVMKKIGKGSLDPENAKSQLRTDLQHIQVFAKDRPGVKIDKMPGYNELVELLRPTS
jgi:hypothetical protein